MPEGKTIWITRPEGQADSLVDSLAQQGFGVRQLPMLEINSLEIDEKIKSVVQGLDHYDLLFFISTNAARLGMEVIQNWWPQFPVQLSVYAVGPTTASVLEEYDLNVEFPAERMSSEGLLALNSLDGLEGKKALIVRGAGGRELLAEQLRSRGALVDYLEVYQRTCPEYEPGILASYYHDDSPSALIVTSVEALENLSALLAEEKLTKEKVDLDKVPLFVSSERIADKARHSGFAKTITMSGADDRAIILSLNENLN